MSSALGFDLKRCAAVASASVLLGWVFGDVVLGLALGLAVLLAQQLHGAWLLQRWMQNHEGALPPRRGLFGDIGMHVDRAQRQARKRKKRLTKVAARFRQAASANPDGAIIIDGADRIEWINKAAAHFLGLRQAQDQGQLVVNLVRNPGFSTWLEARNEDEPFELDSPLNSADRLLLRALPYGDFKRMVIVRNITRLHKLEQMRRDFVANVSHELRSPLTVVVGYLEGMGEDEHLPERLHRPVQQMARQTARMTRIVEDLLRLSRIESEPNAAVHSAINMGDLVDSLLRDAQRITAVEQVFEHNVDHAVLLLGDYNEVYSALSNLLFNAVQYTPAGGRIELNWLADGGGARFEVRDSGEGIEAHHLSRLTERFYRVDKARSQSIGGTGLGLAIVKHVLMRHEAHLRISSEIGKGSLFACEFPASRVDCQPMQHDTPLDATRAPESVIDKDAAPTAISFDAPRG